MWIGRAQYKFGRVQYKFGRAGTNLGRAAGRDLLTAVGGLDLLLGSGGRHAVLELKANGDVTIMDPGSAHGIKLNGGKVRPPPGGSRFIHSQTRPLHASEGDETRRQGSNSP